MWILAALQMKYNQQYLNTELEIQLLIMTLRP